MDNCVNAFLKILNAFSSEGSRGLKLRIRPAAEAAVRRGHPWVFAEAVVQQNRPGAPGELAVVYDKTNHFLAVGMFDPDGPIRLRVLQSGTRATIDNQFWISRLNDALHRRKSLFDDPGTDGFRLIYGESDGWPGLVLDKYSNTLVLKSYTAGWFPRLAEISTLLLERLRPQRLVLRLSRNIQAQAQAQALGGWFDGQLLSGNAPEEPVVFRENGLRFEADVIRGQKTGFFLDQRDNRKRLETFSRNKRILNTFSFSGGFSLYAARGGATHVTDVDISQHALDSSERNFQLNQDLAAVRLCRRRAVKADVFEWLAGEKELYDVVVLDPPSLARRESERSGAIESYYRLAHLGIARLAPGGVLAACSCSAHVSQSEFLSAVRRALQRSNRKWAELEICGHPVDHRASFREAEYLKASWVRVE